jgi:hypothetical protein
MAEPDCPTCNTASCQLPDWLGLRRSATVNLQAAELIMAQGHIRMEVEMVLLDGGLLLWYIHNHEAEVIRGYSLQGQEGSLHRLSSSYPGWREIRHG